ncbi:hypothetical protein QBC46DRAFT_359515 [Diplogelasinospora grovesii]|uniref:Uncharacterized protein n=1 Tax=Diplogelasinospora grovesii TaxID=303347 RepID=A0AAN6MWS6_9PEZI|nr:hypothetical protein QBC46DRAFT_359515 [Diplogelasinospora grovesii]
MCIMAIPDQEAVSLLLEVSTNPQHPLYQDLTVWTYIEYGRTFALGLIDTLASQSYPREFAESLTYLYAYYRLFVRGQPFTAPGGDYLHRFNDLLKYEEIDPREIGGILDLAVLSMVRICRTLPFNYQHIIHITQVFGKFDSRTENAALTRGLSYYVCTRITFEYDHHESFRNVRVLLETPAEDY